VPEQNVGGPPQAGDEGAADPKVAAALAAYASGAGSEHAALTALAGSRLLVPVVAVPADGADGTAGADGTDEAGEAGGAGDAGGTGRPRSGEKVSEMALPMLVGHDGRAAVLAFTGLDSLTRWRPDARPVPVPAPRVWLAGTQEASAVVIDIAGPVPLAVEGARLAALAAGRSAPRPHEDQDVQAAAEAALASETLITGATLITGGTLADPGDTSDVTLQVTLAAGCDAALAGAAVRRVVAGLMAATGGRLRRGVGVAVVGTTRPAARP
jgi:type III secretion system (T3SS) SseB-like protein